MKNYNNIFIAAALLAMVLSPIVFAQTAFAKASISVSPNRIVFGQRDRKATIYVINSGDEKANYRIELVRKRMSDDGKYIDVKKPLPNERFADDFLRISPRSFSLGVGETQIVRIHLRRKKNMEDGEYRVHLRSYIVPPPPPPNVNAEKDDKLHIELRANFGMAIPVIVRQGKLDYAVTVGDINVKPDKDGKQILRTQFMRTGGRSAYGDISIVFTDNAGKEHLLKFMGGLSVFTPNPVRKFTIPLDVPDGMKLTGGTLKVIYREKPEEGGAVIAEKSMKL